MKLFGTRVLSLGVIVSYRRNIPAKLKYPSVETPNVKMPKAEINIPEHLEMQIAQLVEKGEFLNREEAIEDLLSTGIKAYKTSGPVDEDEEAGLEDDGMMGHDDEYVF
jgi:Arc/MetJ-type ribon-helix-helix transcriptional regulator